ncbi:MAG: alpha/beta fold hydrolase [Hyphomonadaceae bacterium]|nr:alpha/beta fold hydrolase [Hyphomonadaceae bacterium]
MRRFAASDGLEIALHEFGDAGDPYPVLLQHGFSASSAGNWIAPGIVDALTKAGRRVVAIDARGHGGSDMPHEPARYARTRLAADISEAADVVGAERFDLAGYSMGGMVGVVTAAKDARVQRLAICGCVRQIVQDRGRDPSFSTVPAALRAASIEEVTSPWGRTFRAVAERMGGDLHALAACFEGLEVGAQESRDALPLIRARTLVIGGRSDPLMKDAEAFTGAIAGAHLEWVDGDHLTAVVDPRFTAALTAFLA